MCPVSPSVIKRFLTVRVDNTGATSALIKAADTLGPTTAHFMMP